MPDKDEQIPPYGVAIQEVILRGNLAEMKQVVVDAEKYLSDSGDIRSSLELLQIEIAKLERKR